MAKLLGGTTVYGLLSATGVVSMSGIRVNNAFNTSTAVGSLTAKLPIYNSTGTLIGYIPIYTS